MPDTMDSDPDALIQIDEALEKIRLLKGKDPTESDDEWRICVQQFTEGILRYLDIPKSTWQISPRDNLFGEHLSRTQSKFIAVCLLRLLSANQDSFRDVPFRNKAYKLFDEILGPELYKRVNLSPKQQNHEKQRVLQDVVPAFSNPEMSLKSGNDSNAERA
jgi:hypothetical protein